MGSVEQSDVKGSKLSLGSHADSLAYVSLFESTVTFSVSELHVILGQTQESRNHVVD